MELEELLADLDPDQRAAVLSDGAPLCIVAPAGSGKTRVLTRRIARRLADGSADAEHVLALTFTRRAAGELTRRLRSLGARETIAAGTFHGVAYRFLRQRWDDQRRRAPLLVTNRVRLVQELLPELRGGRPPGRGLAEGIAVEIDWARARLIEPGAYVAEAAHAGRRPPAEPADVAKLYARYEEHKRERREVDFDDLLDLLRREIERDGAYAAAIRWRVRHLFVDEFQDVNPLQHRLLEAWRGGRVDLCVVGDPSQAIYGWNGADGRALTEFAVRYPGATVVHLGSSHRSSPQIVAFGHHVLTGAPDGAPAASRPDGPRPRAHRFSDAAQEARGAATLVRQLRPPGGRWSAIAVLARTNAQLGPVASALDGVGVATRRSATVGYEPEFGPVLAGLRSITGRGSLRAWLDEESAAGADGAGDDLESPGPAVPRALLQAAEDLLAQEPAADGAALRAWLAAGGRGDGLGPDEDVVGLFTFHAAKGLEWPAVVVVGAVPGLVPHVSARNRDARDEERRLFHVAVTRAARELHVCWYGNTPSPYLADLERAEAETAPPPPALRVPSRTREEEPLLAALRAWRRETARAARVDENVVADDRTLAAIAAAQPTTVEALAEVAGFGPLMARRHGGRVLAAIRSSS